MLTRIVQRPRMRPLVKGSLTLIIFLCGFVPAMRGAIHVEAERLAAQSAQWQREAEACTAAHRFARANAEKDGIECWGSRDAPTLVSITDARDEMIVNHAMTVMGLRRERPGKVVTIIVSANSTGSFTLQNESADAPALERFRLSGNSDWILQAGTQAALVYTGERWSLINTAQTTMPSLGTFTSSGINYTNTSLTAIGNVPL